MKILYFAFHRRTGLEWHEGKQVTTDVLFLDELTHSGHISCDHLQISHHWNPQMHLTCNQPSFPISLFQPYPGKRTILCFSLFSLFSLPRGQVNTSSARPVFLPADPALDPDAVPTQTASASHALTSSLFLGRLDKRAGRPNNSFFACWKVPPGQNNRRDWMTSPWSQSQYWSTCQWLGGRREAGRAVGEERLAHGLGRWARHSAM